MGNRIVRSSLQHNRMIRQNMETLKRNEDRFLLEARKGVVLSELANPKVTKINTDNVDFIKTKKILNNLLESTKTEEETWRQTFDDQKQRQTDRLHVLQESYLQ